ncbi:acetyl-CoA carboxylase biotin carboxyl carrier protein subunit [Camelliibacillus cellulosilyticus]|uniref:Acetyl-CoA carboxylase biotin carboxyl carrier protein subunit n=1 Tax=Camelliibacillus cellulosilyticus TaxID=2174486 RepID=A0ABV9GGH4_9BACL
MKTIESTMAGTLLNVLVKEGDEVKAGDQIALIESMKMEIPIESDADGVVAEIKGSIGDFINEGDPIVILK